MDLVRWMFTGEDGKPSTTKIGAVLAGLGAIATVWGMDVNPRIVETVGVLGGIMAAIGLRNAPGISGKPGL